MATLSASTLAYAVPVIDLKLGDANSPSKAPNIQLTPTSLQEEPSKAPALSQRKLEELAQFVNSRSGSFPMNEDQWSAIKTVLETNREQVVSVTLTKMKELQEALRS